jgi:hypothetical protein
MDRLARRIASFSLSSESFLIDFGRCQYTSKKKRSLPLSGKDLNARGSIPQSRSGMANVGSA